MKRLILFLVILGFCLCGYSQSEVGKLTFDSGYYQGACLSNTNNKYVTYLFLQFLSNGGDTTLVIVPYKMKNSNSTKTFVKNITAMNDTIEDYLVKLSEVADNIENHEVINRSWSINGFDNFTYFEVVGNKLSFSINIAEMGTDSIEVFYFDGTISATGNEISAVVYSDNGTFPRGTITLQLSPKIIHKNERKEIHQY